MNQFTQYLTESSGSRMKPLDDENTKIILSKKCRKSVKAYLDNQRSGYIWRGVYDRRVTNYQGFGKGEEPRKSANTYNYYTLFMDNHPLWKSYPKRSESFICTTDMNKADIYGSRFAVFPVDGSNIGVCPSRDLWDSFSALRYDSLSDFTKLIYRMLSYAQDYINVNYADDNWPTFVRQSETLEKWLHEDYDDTAYDSVEDTSEQKRWIDNFNYSQIFLKYFEYSIIEMMEQVVNPDDFKLIKSGDSVPRSSEVWTDGQCIFVHEDKLTKEWVEEMRELI